VVFAVDVSASISPDSLDAATRWMSQATARGAPAHVRHLAFADRTEVIASPEALGALPVTMGQSGTRRRNGGEGPIDRSATNLERALQEAIHHFAPHRLKRLVLFTDGNPTTGELPRALRRLQQEGVRVFTVPARVREEGDAFVEGVVLPEAVQAREPVEVRVRIFSQKETQAAVELARAGEIVGRKQVALRAGANEVAFQIRAAEEGMTRLEVALEAEGDGFAENNRLAHAFWVGPPARVLYVEGTPESGQYLKRALEKEGIAVAVGSAEDLPERADGFEGFDAVILSDVAAPRLSEKSMSALETYVGEAGGGLLFAAGETSYGESGYSETVVEKILPVRFRVAEKKKDLALVIVLDKSYSMLGQKIDLAKEAARAALDLLEPTHRFGVVTFNWDPYVTVSLQAVSELARASMAEEIGRIQASGQTNIHPALKIAATQLGGTEAKVKHVILLSDGKSYPNDYQSLVTRMARDKITVSAVAVGEEADRELLANIARWGSGRSYFIEDARRVPQIFIEETRLAVQATLIEEPFRPAVVRAVEALRGIDFARAPLLRGYVSTEAKDNAEVLLDSPTHAPVLARWQYGLGKAVVFTSDVKNRWAADWLAWPGYGRLWGQLVRETMRRGSRNELDFQVGREGEEAVVSLRAVGADGRYPSGLLPAVEVTAPDGNLTRSTLRQTGPGAFEGRLAVSPSRAPSVFRLLDPANETKGAPPQALPFPYADEYRLYPVNEDLLRRIAQETGGKYRPEIADLFADYGDRAQVPTPLAPLLAALALVAFLFDIAVRRAPWFWKRFDSGARATAAPAAGRQEAA
jgi:uncharacterized membrane protein